jgi:hypothetical protein
VRHLDHDLEKMVSLGVDAVSICVQVSQLTNWHQQRLRNVVDRAHAFGLKVHAAPNRWCGLTAGWLDGVSEWTLANADALRPGSGHCDPRNPKVRRRYEGNLRILLEGFGFDGVVWDEPRPPEADVIGFLDEMSAFVKSVRRDALVSMFAEAGDLHLAETFAGTRHVDYLGSDGHVRSDAHRMHRMKNTIFTAHAAFFPVLAAAGKKTVFLPEAQRHRDEDLDDYLSNVERAFSLPMDQLMFYYSAHEMSPRNEEAFNRATWAAVASLRRA